MVQAILFDMDGVLLDSERYGMEVTCRAANRLGFPMTHAHFKSILGLNSEETKQAFKHIFGPEYPGDLVDGAYWTAMLQAAKAGELPVKEGLAECLEGLRARDLALGLVTSSDRMAVEVYLRHVPQLQGGFDVVVCGEDVTQGKPAPDCYLLAAKQLGVLPGNCLGVEDSRNGLRSLKAAGIPAVMIPDLLPYEDSLAALVDWRVGSLKELCPLVDGLGR